eukprot:313592-Rhodomonas_salina.2
MSAADVPCACRCQVSAVIHTLLCAADVEHVGLEVGHHWPLAEILKYAPISAYAHATRRPVLSCRMGVPGLWTSRKSLRTSSKVATALPSVLPKPYVVSGTHVTRLLLPGALAVKNIVARSSIPYAPPTKSPNAVVMVNSVDSTGVASSTSPETMPYAHPGAWPVLVHCIAAPELGPS